MSADPPPPPSLRVEDLEQVFGDIDPALLQEPPYSSESAVCQIQYKPEFRIAFGYFRALLASAREREEVSERALRLTELCASLNPANYTVWQHRRYLLSRLDFFGRREEEARSSSGGVGGSPENARKMLMAAVRRTVAYEMGLAERLGGDNPKNFQIWYHRRAVLEAALDRLANRRLPRRRRHEQEHLASSSSSSLEVERNKDDGVEDDDDVVEEGQVLAAALLRLELEYVAAVIHSDGKNYHAWTHRQWVLKARESVFHSVSSFAATGSASSRYDVLWETELEYAARLIEKDGRNNSAWNHRWFVISCMAAANYGGGRERRHPVDDTDGIVASSDHRSIMMMDDVAAVFLDPQVLDREIRFALASIRVDPHNESPWRYYVALAKRRVKQELAFAASSSPPDDGPTEGVVDQVLAEFERQAWDVMPNAAAANANHEDDNDDIEQEPISRHLLGAVVDILELRLSVGAAGATLRSGETASNDEATGQSSALLLPKVLDLCHRLELLDPIRQKYWRWRATTFQ
jgi:protein farnesyltransferase/geranylgeranyltransferase type-1 subunit alpha